MAGVAETLTLDQFSAWSGRVAARLERGSLEVPFKRCAVLINADVRRNFHEGHDPNGVPWLPLKHRQGKPLRDHGLLMASATAQGPGHVELITDTMLVVGTNLDYAAVHNYGATIHKQEQRRPYPQKPWVFDVGGETVFTRRIKEHTIIIPARQFIGLNEKVTEKIGLIFGDWMIEQVKAA